MPDGSEDRPTMVPCPKCDGEGFVVLESTGTTHRGTCCDLCDSLGVVTVGVMRLFKVSAHAASRRT